MQFPLFARPHFTIKNTKYTLIGVVVAAFVCEIPLIFHVVFRNTGYFLQFHASGYYAHYSSILQIYGVVLKPTLFLSCFCLIFAINTATAGIVARRKRSQIRRTPRTAKQNRTTLMLVILVFAFVICNTPMQTLEIFGFFHNDARICIEGHIMDLNSIANTV